MNCMRLLQETTLDVFNLLLQAAVHYWLLVSQSNNIRFSSFQDIKVRLLRIFNTNFAGNMMEFQ